MRKQSAFFQNVQIKKMHLNKYVYCEGWNTIMPSQNEYEDLNILLEKVANNNIKVYIYECSVYYITRTI
jgi:hypothetical protein